MQKTAEYYLINQLTKKLNVLVIQSSCEIKNNFSPYFEKIFNNIDYIYKYDDLINYIQTSRPDFIFIDIQTKDIQPFNFIKTIQNIIPNQIIILISHIDNKEILLKSIRLHISSFLKKPFTITDLKDTIVDCLDYIFINKHDILLKHKLLIKNTNVKDAISYLMEHYQVDIELINHYKGVPLIRSASIVDIVDDTVSVKIKDIQKYILDYSHHTIINTNYFTGDIYAYLKEVNYEKNIAIFHKLSFINSYIHHRKNARIVPDSHFQMFIEIDNTKYKCDIIDISINYTLITLPTLPNKLSINSEQKLFFSFREPKYFLQNKFEIDHITTQCTVSNIFDTKNIEKTLIYFELQDIDKQKLEKYIYKRGLELVDEFKNKYLQNK
ncbi:MAG: response regulator [Arcobacteraceae bacterium]|nr:response regulator [Arcobacteraceae bacterium]